MIDITRDTRKAGLKPCATEDPDSQRRVRLKPDPTDTGLSTYDCGLSTLDFPNP